MSVVTRYLELGLALGRHVDGLVDAYYGPPELARRAAAGPLRAPAALAEDGRRLLAELAAGGSGGGTGGGTGGGDGDGDGADLDPGRRRWLAAQVEGLRATASKLAGEAVRYADEVESCYGVRPRRVPEDELAAAHRRLGAALPGSGPLAGRLIAWRESQAVPVDRLEAAVRSLAEDLRERTAGLFGFPEGDRIDFELVTDKPWAGFNYYLGGLRSRVAVNVDLPVLSPSLAHLVAHEAYPGHHTEHCHKEVGLVRRRHQEEETIFLVGTPQCLIAEGLADLGLEVVMGRRPEALVAGHLHPLGIPYDAEVVASVAEAGEALGAVRGNVALLLHEDGADRDTAVAYAARWALLPEARASKLVDFLTDPTWRAYMTCYVEGLPLCRRFVAGDPERFRRLITQQLVPADLAAAA
jgi:hypothetical protein